MDFCSVNCTVIVSNSKCLIWLWLPWSYFWLSISWFSSGLEVEILMLIANVQQQYGWEVLFLECLFSFSPSYRCQLLFFPSLWKQIKCCPVLCYTNNFVSGRRKEIINFHVYLHMCHTVGVGGREQCIFYFFNVFVCIQKYIKYCDFLQWMFE